MGAAKMATYREPVPDGTKRCGHCHKIKPVTEFQKNRSTYDGLQTYCRECQNAASQESKRARRNYRETQLRIILEGD